jgi:DnaJ-domain-containing protein 1
MPKIFLKPNSAEFIDERTAQPERCCDMPGCNEEAPHKAPKDRSLEEYYWFCIEHVQEYNKAWNFFSGLSQHDIEDHIVRSALWDRPTWRYDSFAEIENHLRTKAWQTYHNTDKEPSQERTEKEYTNTIGHGTPEFEAMAIMGLEPPLDLLSIKARYKELVKKHHPDVNRDDPKKAEELLKNINMAYTILKLAYDKYEKLPTKENS